MTTQAPTPPAGGLGAILNRISESPWFREIFLYNLLQLVLGAALDPVLDEISDRAWEKLRGRELNPAEAADAVVRNLWDFARAYEDAKSAGLTEERFQTLVDLSGNPPGPEFLAEAARLGIIPWEGRGPDAVSFEQGISEGRLKNKWLEVIRQASRRYPTVIETIEAVLKAQIDEGAGRELYERVGGVPEFFDLLLGLQGEAPTPLQAADMAHRGIIPWEGTGPDVLSFEQAVREGRWRNKWLPAFRKLSEYLPPPRTITAMFREGALTAQEATELLIRNGLPEELAVRYVQAGSRTKLQRQRDLALGHIERLYRYRVVERATAAELIRDLGYDAQEADFILDLQDLERLVQFEELAIRRVRSLYIARKIDEATAATLLDRFGVPANQREELLELWELEREVEVRLLTPAEIKRAFRRGLFDQATAMARLQELGYRPEDADVYLRI